MGHAFLLAVAVAITLMRVSAQSPAAADALAQRIAHPDPAAYRQLSAVHGGAGSMSFTALLNRGAVTPEFNFLHRGVIPAGSGIGHHFHNVVEEMFVILDGEAQFTIDGRTRTRSGTPRSGSERPALAARRRTIHVLDDVVLYRSRCRPSRRGDSRAPA